MFGTGGTAVIKAVMYKGEPFEVLVSEVDLPLWESRKWYLRNNGYVGTPYDRGQVRSTMYLHRAIMGLPPGRSLVVDHINHNKRDNRRENLRVVSQSFNMLNRAPRVFGTHPEPGVSWDNNKRRWVAKIKIDGRVHGRQFINADDAIIYARELRRAYCG
jgi:hypothetical protein